MDKIIFIDTVATGLNPEKCAIYRLGGILTEDCVETKRFEIRVRPFANARINEQALWICNESRLSLVHYPDEKETMEFLLEILDGFINVRNAKDKAYLAGFNVTAFDMPFLREFFFRNGNRRFRDYFHVQTLDLMTLSAFTLMDKRETMQDFHLETVARKLGIECLDEGKYDCLSNAKVSLDMYRVLQTRLGLGECTDVHVAEETIRNY